METGESARNYCELSGRTEPLMADVIVALINMGMKLDNIEIYAKRQNRTVLPPLQQQTQSKQLNILQAGVKQSHPSHIPSYLPPFPDPHAYIRTPVSVYKLIVTFCWYMLIVTFCWCMLIKIRILHKVHVVCDLIIEEIL